MNSQALSPCIGCAAAGACGQRSGPSRPGGPGRPLLAGHRVQPDLPEPSPRGLLWLSLLCFGLPLAVLAAVLPQLDGAGAGAQLLAVFAVLAAVALLVRAVPEPRIRRLMLLGSTGR